MSPAQAELRSEIYRAIDAERAHQAALFPDDERELDMFVGLAVLGLANGECHRAALNCREDAALDKDAAIYEGALRRYLIESAAVAVKLLELLDRSALYISHSTAEQSVDQPAQRPTLGEKFWCGECNNLIEDLTLTLTACPHCGAGIEAPIGDPS